MIFMGNYTGKNASGEIAQASLFFDDRESEVHTSVGRNTSTNRYDSKEEAEAAYEAFVTQHITLGYKRTNRLTTF